MNLNPIDIASRYYESQGIDFLEDWSKYSLMGVVISDPNIFTMARMVEKGADVEIIRDPTYTFHNPNCWHIHYYSGKIDALFRYEQAAYPGMKPLPWVCFERGGENFKYYNRERIQSIAERIAA